MAPHNPGFLRLVEEAKRFVTECSIDDVKGQLDSGAAFSLVDVREDHEWAVDHIAGALHMGRGVLERDVETKIPDPKASIVLYCGGGFRSALAAWNLTKMGYTNVKSMAGGIRAWRDAGFPLEKP
jgi:rhodanese-related sulfurtransferase